MFKALSNLYVPTAVMFKALLDDTLVPKEVLESPGKTLTSLRVSVVILQGFMKLLTVLMIF
jgi:hypothetical protein